MFAPIPPANFPHGAYMSADRRFDLPHALFKAGTRHPQFVRTLDRYSTRIIAKDSSGHFLALNQAAILDFRLVEKSPISQYTDEDFYTPAYVQSSTQTELAVLNSLSPSLSSCHRRRCASIR